MAARTWKARQVDLWGRYRLSLDTRHVAPQHRSSATSFCSFVGSCQEGLPVAETARASGVSVRTPYEGLIRYRAKPLWGSWTAFRARIVVRIAPATRTYREISRKLGVAPSTVGRIAQHAGVNRLSPLEPPAPTNRYFYPDPEDLPHPDIKNLGVSCAPACPAPAGSSCNGYDRPPLPATAGSLRVLVAERRTDAST